MGAEPLLPSNVDLRDLVYMPVDIVRLFGSDFHANATDAEWRAGVTLWLKSFHQVPAASLPPEEAALARLAEFGRDLKGWRKVSPMALHGWSECSDGRLYHPVVAEKALEAWIERLMQRKSSGAGNARRWGASFDEATAAKEIEDAGSCLARLNPNSRILQKRLRTPSTGNAGVTPGGSPGGTSTGNAGGKNEAKSDENGANQRKIVNGAARDKNHATHKRDETGHESAPYHETKYNENSDTIYPGGISTGSPDRYPDGWHRESQAKLSEAKLSEAQSTSQPSSTPPASPSAIEFDRVTAACSEALGAAAPADAVIGPIILLIQRGTPLETVLTVLRSEARRPRRKPIRTWHIWAEIVAERLAEAGPPGGNGAANGAAFEKSYDLGGGLSITETRMRSMVARYRATPGFSMPHWGDEAELRAKTPAALAHLWDAAPALAQFGIREVDG